MSAIGRFAKWIVFSAGLLAVVAQAQTQNITSGTDPNGIYWCGDTYRAKSDLVYEFGRTLAKVNGIAVLKCQPVDGGGGTYQISCPAGSPYAYCLRNDNDGAGNHVELGILEMNSATDPNARYGACAAGAGYRSKASVVLEAKDNLRDINGIVVTRCTKADGPRGTKKVACSKANNSYSACYVNQDDGVGNHVELGVISAWGLPDVTGQYGGVGTKTYRSKAMLVTEAGKDIDKILSVVPLFGRSGIGTGGTTVDGCSGYPTAPYAYCIRNESDPAGNYIYVGVIEKP